MPEPLYLAGQTGSGKTAVALELSRRIGPVEIVNADAFQVYRGMEILSAAPSAGERGIVPHHLFGILDPGEECDAAFFAECARNTIAEVGDRALPLVVGGSGLYLKAITHGLAPTPKGDPEVRAELDRLSLDALVARYTELDPEGAAKTNLKNRRYVTRNLEICLLAGEPASRIKDRWEREAPSLRAVYLQREREDIYERINRRTEAMFEAGVIAEVAALGELSTTAAKAIGIREIHAHLASEISREECLEQIRTITRRYAKRQETWFRREREFVPLPVAADEPPERTAERVVEQFPSVLPQ